MRASRVKAAHAGARRLLRLGAPCVAGLAAFLGTGVAAASSSGDELVRQAKAHEAAHEDDVALRRYTDALSIDRTNAEAWLGLGALRLRLHEPEEAERVYVAALDQIPSLHGALRGRAEARWMMGRRAEAEADLDTYARAETDVAALRELADWYGADGRTPAQLAAWRRILVLAQGGDPALEREARRTVRALVILVDGADPAASPVAPDATRRGMARIAARGG